MRSARVGIIVLAVIALGAAGCGGDGDEGAPQGPASTAPSDASVNLAGTGPSPIVIQTDCDPESEYGVYYLLLGANP
jgi:hypothetical protein